MEFPIQAIAAWDKQDKRLVANSYPARNERVVVFSPKYHSGVPCLSTFRFPAP